ncbi:MAG: ORF6N domain-containing protein, partial [Bacteroidales bacterium]|nr:ORF6N domain-containing protein [Bacteroidales bacterium]
METEVIAKKGNRSITSLIEDVEEKIVVIRNQQVIADADVAVLYGVQTKDINRAVRNNPDKFPPHYMFELTISELRDMRLKILTTNVS